MGDLVLALDLGTGSCKASIWDPSGSPVASSVRPYPTDYHNGFHEQRLDDWWQAVVDSTRALTSEPGQRSRIGAIALSGQSLGVIGLDRAGEPVRRITPIWSDPRGGDAARRAFGRIDEAHWYRTTGNGFPAGLYPVFKLGWYADHDPEFLTATKTIVGSKDWLNARLTGVLATDPSYASGSGAWNLLRADWDEAIMAAARIDTDLWPTVMPSTSVLGTLTTPAADELGLSPQVVVTAGGVDNSCMSAGSLSFQQGSAFISLGSSSWYVATAQQPVVDQERRPYTFASLTPGLYDSALSSFSAGITLRWLRSVLGGGTPLTDEELIALARQSEPGAHGLTFLPMLTGGAPHEGGPDVRGSMVGLDSSHTAADLARAAIEGTVFAIARAGRMLGELVDVSSDVVVSGGGSASPWIRQLYAEALGHTIISTTVDQQAAALGAASTAFVALGLWPDISASARAHRVVARHVPAEGDRYVELLDRFDQAMAHHLTEGIP